MTDNNAPVPVGVFGSFNSLQIGALLPLIGGLDSGICDDVGRYLRNGHMCLPIMEYTHDIIGSQFGVSGGSAFLTDGTFYWRADAAEYVSHYRIQLPDEFIRHVEDADFRIPSLSKEAISRIERYLLSPQNGN